MCCDHEFIFHCLSKIHFLSLQSRHSREILLERLILFPGVEFGRDLAENARDREKKVQQVSWAPRSL